MWKYRLATLSLLGAWFFAAAPVAVFADNWPAPQTPGCSDCVGYAGCSDCGGGHGHVRQLWNEWVRGRRVISLMGTRHNPVCRLSGPPGYWDAPSGGLPGPWQPAAPAATQPAALQQSGPESAATPPAAAEPSTTQPPVTPPSP
jgi:hypothetical protein